MNILILTPTDPQSILLCGQSLFGEYGDKNDIFSVQMMALLDEDKNQNHTYIASNNLFAAEVRDNPRVSIARNKRYDNLIVFGNCDNKSIKFDHIITWDDAWEDDNEDTYLAKQSELFEEDFRNHSIKPIRWYKRADAEFSFPTWRHLCIFLKTLGVESNGVQ